MSRKWKRNRQTPATPSGQWCGRPREMLESAAYRVLSRAGHQVLSRIELELRYHVAKRTAACRSRSKNFVAYGIDRGGIAPALREVQALGFAEITQHGRGGNAEYRLPNLFRLTYEPTKKDVAPTNEWKRFAAGADHAADTKMMAEAAKVADGKIHREVSRLGREQAPRSGNRVVARLLRRPFDPAEDDRLAVFGFDRAPRLRFRM
jgi:hypothetical protein